MAAFVLVHGSGQNATCWERVAERLRGHGHQVATPDLPKRAAGWGLADHAEAIAAAITEPESVVVGHSFSGAFLPLVPARTRDCRLLVYLAAVIPEPRKSVRDQLAEDPAMFGKGWLEAGPRWFDPTQTEGLAREFLFHDCDETAMPWALRTMEFMDTRHLVTQPCPLETWPSMPAVSIVAALDRTLSVAWGRRMSRRMLGRAAIEVRSGHSPQVSRPEEIAELLARLAPESSA